MNNQNRPVIVMGHKNPDTDSICAAITYANLKRKVTGGDYIACRAGHLNEETQFVLSHFGVEFYSKKEVTKQMDTWLDAIRNLRNYCAHHSMVIGMTSSVVILDKRDSTSLLPNNTNLYSRLYALKKVLSYKDGESLGNELNKLVSSSKIDIYKMGILPVDWKKLYDQIVIL